MQITTSRRTKDHIPAEKLASYRIDTAAVVHITRILRNMYEDPVRAVVREYTANALDAHQITGTDAPIEITGPSHFKAEFSVRDYGRGLSVADVEKLLLGYGASGEEKRTSNEQIGGFGIGCKCAFAVTDSFTYVSWYEGKKQTWLCQLDDHDMGQAKLVSHTQSDEPPGILVKIPVAQAQLRQFEEQLRTVPMFFRRPYKLNGKLVEPGKAIRRILSGSFEPGSGFDGGSWELCKDDVGILGKLVVVMGDLWYPVELSQIEGFSSTALSNVMDFNTAVCILHLPIGVLSLAPTRETLQYDIRTKKLLSTLMLAIESGFKKVAQAEIDATTNTWEASKKALDLQRQWMYQTGRVAGPNSAVTFEWHGVNYEFEQACGIPTGPNTFGVKVILAVRDVRRRGTSYWAKPKDGALKVRVFDLSDPKLELHKTSGYLDSRVSSAWEYVPPSTLVTVSKSELPEYLGSRSSDNTAAERMIHHRTERGKFWIRSFVVLDNTDKEAEKFILVQSIPVFSMLPSKGTAKFFAARYLISQAESAPNRLAYALILQGKDNDVKAMLKAYPWLEAGGAITPLPLLPPQRNTVATAGARSPTGHIYKATNNMFKFNGTVSRSAPSSGWDPVAELPKGVEMPAFYLEHFVPSDRPGPATSVPKDFTPTASPDMMSAYVKALELLTHSKSPSDIYGFRITPNNMTAPPAGVVFVTDSIDALLRKWVDPNYLGKISPHGFHVLVRYGLESELPTGCLSNGCATLVKEWGVPAQKFDGWYGRGDMTRDLFVAFRERKFRSLIDAQRLRPDSPFQVAMDTYLKLTGLDTLTEDEIDNYREMLQKLSHTVMPAVLKSNPALMTALKSYTAPLSTAMDTLRSAYPMFETVKSVMCDAKSHRVIIAEYIKMMDK